MATLGGMSGGARPAERHRTDEELLDLALKRLRKEGRIDYEGEFGPEITTFLPFVNWLKQEGHLEGRQVGTYRGMKPYYFFLDQDQIVERDGKRGWFTDEKRLWPTHSTYTATLKPWHRPPDFRAHYAPRARHFSKPTLFVQNKFAVEWSVGPINYLPLNRIERLSEIARDRFQIVYSRPGARTAIQDFSNDLNEFCHYPDLAYAKRDPDLLVLEEMAQEEGRSYNELKLEVLAGCHLFVSVQGGGAHLLAAFSNALLIVLHRIGPEYPHAYEQGPYKYLANPAPHLIVARGGPDLDQALDVLDSVKFEDGQMMANLPKEGLSGGR